MPSCPVCARPRHLCFPAISRVTLASGASISMRQLRIGDRVRTLGTNGETADSEVIAFLHKETEIKADFLKLEIQGGYAITLSPQHLIFRKENSTSAISAVFASAIRPGDLLYTSNGTSSKYKAVTRISIVTEIGVYAPLSTQGTLLADGVLVSCYATWPSHDTAHFVMAPFRAAYAITGAWRRLTSLMEGTYGVSSRQTDSPDGIPWYALALMTLANVFI